MTQLPKQIQWPYTCMGGNICHKDGLGRHPSIREDFDFVEDLYCRMLKGVGDYYAFLKEVNERWGPEGPEAGKRDGFHIGHDLVEKFGVKTGAVLPPSKDRFGRPIRGDAFDGWLPEEYDGYRPAAAIACEIPCMSQETLEGSAESQVRSKKFGHVVLLNMTDVLNIRSLLEVFGKLDQIDRGKLVEYASRGVGDALLMLSSDELEISEWESNPQRVLNSCDHAIHEISRYSLWLNEALNVVTRAKWELKRQLERQAP